MKKKKLFLLSILLICFFMFNLNIRVSAATAMYVRCTRDPDGQMGYLDKKYYSGDQLYRYYNTFTLINDMGDNGIRHMVFPGGSGNFTRGNIGATFILYKNATSDPDGEVTDKVCWYRDIYTNDDGPMSECDSDNDENYVPITELLNGKCPEYVMETTGSGTSGLLSAFTDIFSASGFRSGILGDFLVLAGVSKEASEAEFIKSDKMIIYKAYDDWYRDTNADGYNGDMYIIEVYDEEGRYGYISTADYPDDSSNAFTNRLGSYPLPDSADVNDILATDDLCSYSLDYADWAMTTQMMRIAVTSDENVKHYFKITEDDKYPFALLVGLPSGSGCKKNDKHVFKDEAWKPIYFDPFLNKITQSDIIKKWYDENSYILEDDRNEIIKFKGKGEFDLKVNGEYYDLIQQSKRIANAVKNKSNYSFSGEPYNPSEFVEKTKDAIVSLNSITGEARRDGGYKAYRTGCSDDDADYISENGNEWLRAQGSSAAISSAYSYFSCKLFGKPDIVESNNYSKNAKLVGNIMLKYVSNQVNSFSGSGFDVLTLSKETSEYIELLSIAIGYIKEQGLVDSSDLSMIFSNLQELSTKYGFQVVTDCESLLGDKLITRIQKYADILKVTIPILLIGFGILDFSKALFSSDEDSMKKAQKTFLKRLLIAILFYFTPVLVKLLLNIANEVWQFISPGTCGLF